MKTLLLSALLVISSLLSTGAEASQSTLDSIDRALQITNVEMQAIYSGRYQYYRPETIRGILSRLSQEAGQALSASESSEARHDLSNLLRSINEEYAYSSRFQYYRLESTRLLMLNYQRFLNQARQSERMHGSQGHNGGSFGGCNGPGRVGCL